MIDTLGFASIATFIGLVAINLVLVDKILRRVHDRYPSEWDRLGQPGGYFWWPEGRPLWRGCLARDRITHFLVFRRPKWINLDAELLAWWKKARVVGTISLVAWIVGMICILTPREETSEQAESTVPVKAAPSASSTVR